MEVTAFQLARRRTNKNKPNTEARIAKQGVGFNPSNIYFTVNYDCQNTDVEIRGIVPKGIYWSLVAYDKYTMPLNSYLFDKTIKKDEEDRYIAYLTTKPKGRSNEIDVSASPKGLVLIRSSLPENPDRVVKAVPQVRSIPQN
ncbi:MAG TPA: hypothetical protein V6D50_23400 [Chroococcales cyanobacterium]